MNACASASIFASLLFACSSSQPGGASSGSNSSSQVHVTCTQPAAANTMDGGIGCQASAAAEYCQVSSGATILLDGGVENGTATCDNKCAPNELALTCMGAPASTNVPPPDPSLKCRGTGGPMPSNVLVYCCACDGVTIP